MKKLTEPPHKEIVRPREVVIATAEEHQQDAQDRANNGDSDRNPDFVTQKTRIL